MDAIRVVDGRGLSHKCPWRVWLLSMAISPLPLAAQALNDEVVSRNANGELANGGSNAAAISGTGRYVAFASGATNLVPDDTNGFTDVFVFDRATGSIVRASTDPSGGQAIGASDSPAITPDGRYVVFRSDAGDLLMPDGNDRADIVLKDLQTGAVERIDEGDNPIGGCFAPDISDDAQRIVYECSSNGVILNRSVMLRDRGAQTRVSVYSGFDEFQELRPRISGNGGFVTFVSSNDTLVGGDGNGLRDVFVWDVPAEVYALVSVDAFGTPHGATEDRATISAGGCQIAFASSSNQLVSGDFNLEQDVFVRDVCAGTTERVSVDSEGFELQGESSRPSISADGRYVAFQTNDPFFRPFEQQVNYYLVARDRGGVGATAHASTYLIGGQTFDFFAIEVALSDDGRQLAAQVSGNDPSDQVVAVANPLFLTQEISPVNDPNGGEMFAPALSSGGDLVLVSSDASGFNEGWTGNDADGIEDTFVFRPDRGDGNGACMEQVSMSDGDYNSPCFNPDAQRAKAAKGNNGPTVPCGSDPPESVTEICAPTMEPALAAGRMLAAFVVDDGAVNFVANQTKAQMRAHKQAGTHGVYLRNLITGALFRIGTGMTGGSGSAPQLSADGRSIVFISEAPLDADDGNNGADAYLIGIKPDPADGFDPPRCLSCKNADGSDNPPGAKDPVVSANGAVVAMTVPTASGGNQVLLRNLLSGSSQRIGTPDGTAFKPRLDFSGRNIVFGSDENLDGEDGNGKEDVYHFDTCCNKLTRVTGGAGVDADEGSFDPAISGDGKTVSFVSRATNLDPGDSASNGTQNVYLQRLNAARDRIRLARNAQGQLANGDSFRPALNYNGTALYYDSLADNLKQDDDNDGRDVFRRSNPFDPNTVFSTGFE